MKWIPALLALVNLQPAEAIERIRIQAESVAAADVTLLRVDATLQVQSATRSTVALNAARVQLAPSVEAQTGPITALQLRCANPIVREPRFECPDLSLQAHSARWPDIRITGKAGFRSDIGTYIATGSGMKIAGAPLQFKIAGDAAGLQAQLDLQGLQLGEVKKLFAAQLPLPADLDITGTGHLKLVVTQRRDINVADVTLSLQDAGFQNTAYTWIGEKLALNARATADLAHPPLTFTVTATATKGQTLLGPVLLDFDQNPLELKVRGNASAKQVQILSFESQQQNLANVSGTAQLHLAPFSVVEAQLDARDVRFPAAYTSYLQLILATTPFNQLTTTGSAELLLQLRNDQPRQLDLKVQDLVLSDPSRKLHVDGVNSELHWTQGLTGPPRPSWLAWESSQGWDIIGARTRLDFIAQDRDLRLLKPARLPFFDGALLINQMAIEHVGADDMTGLFDAVVEPISVGPIAKALGWPEFAGQLAGRIPGLTYKDKVLTLQGNLDANVFDGRVVASNLRVRDPLGAWPRLYADVTARNLDLELVTRTFEFGTITGRLDVDLAGLETFNWSPVSFDLLLATPKTDRSKHRISQRAVQNLSDIGGGGGGVAAALQSGALKFFDDFRYDRIGLACRLRNDICQMSGAGDAKSGFYIVKGAGLPRIDIIGNNRRVDWPRLMTQVSDALSNPEAIAVK
jgi:hypothetical protein